MLISLVYFDYKTGLSLDLPNQSQKSRSVLYLDIWDCVGITNK